MSCKCRGNQRESSGAFRTHHPFLFHPGGSDCFWRGGRIALKLIFLSWMSCFQLIVYHSTMWLVTHLWTERRNNNFTKPALMGEGLSHALHRSVTYWEWVKWQQICLTRNGLICLEESKNMTYGWGGECRAKNPRVEQSQKADGGEKRKGMYENVNKL